ncbi:hypothetical protein TruAng_004272 [Truncatella angustata]|nr:hypothetical protein TruAng_004272 [Truncatella angustata]
MEGSERAPRTSRGRGGRHRGGRGGRGRGGTQNAITTSQTHPSEHAPTAAPASLSRVDSNQTQNLQSGRGSRRSRNSRRGGTNAGQRTTFGGQRTFGGQLTTEQQPEEDAEAGAPSLNIEAKDFVPGQPTHSTGNNAKASQAKGKLLHVRRGSKSNATDLPTRIHEDITYGQYECVICTNEVLPNSRIWSCTTCWSVLHMSCARKWYTNQMKKPDQPGAPAPAGWRCPGCNSSLTEEPSTYHCWCGQLVLTLAGPWSATQDHAHHVRAWGRPFRVFVASMSLRSVAVKQIMPTAGAVKKFVEICYPAESMNVLVHVIVASAVAVIYQSLHFATAARNIRISRASSAVIEKLPTITGN